MIVQRNLCYFCHKELMLTDKQFIDGDPVYVCPHCPHNIEHLFYDSQGSLNLTLAYSFNISDQNYILYLYPTYKPSLLLVHKEAGDAPDYSDEHILILPSMEGFNPSNISNKAITLVKMKAFY